MIAMMVLAQDNRCNILAGRITMFCPQKRSSRQRSVIKADTPEDTLGRGEKKIWSVVRTERIPGHRRDIVVVSHDVEFRYRKGL